LNGYFFKYLLGKCLLHQEEAERC